MNGGSRSGNGSSTSKELSYQYSNVRCEGGSSGALWNLINYGIPLETYRQIDDKCAQGFKVVSVVVRAHEVEVAYEPYEIVHRQTYAA